MFKERIRNLEENIITLEDFKKKNPIEEVLEDKIKQWALRYGIFECIQEVIDISCSLVSDRNLGNPKNYRECIEILVENKYIPEDLGKRLIQMVGLRNLLVHEYIKIDLIKLYRFLENLEDLKEFIRHIGMSNG